MNSKLGGKFIGLYFDRYASSNNLAKRRILNSDCLVALPIAADLVDGNFQLCYKRSLDILHYYACSYR